MHVTSLFLENFFGGYSMSLGSMIPSSSVLSSSLTTTELTATGSSTAGTAFIDDDPVLGVSSIVLGITTASNGFSTVRDTSKQLELTQAYIESMDERELEDFIVKLEQKQVGETTQETNPFQK